MAEVKTEDIRNICLAGHGGSGKTSLVDGIIYAYSASKRLGKVDDGTSVSDTNSDEIERKISISTSLLHCIVGNTKVNVLDTPGYLDFIGEVVSGLSVADLAVIVINATSGVEVGTELVSKYADEYGIPKMIVFNKIDKENIDGAAILEQAQQSIGAGVIPIELPAEIGPNFKSVVDLIKMKLVTYSSDKGDFSESDIPSNLTADAEAAREKLVEMVAESDDEILENYFENGDLTEEEFKKGLAKGFFSGSIIPAMYTAATLNFGPKKLIDFIAQYGPSPADFSPKTGIEPKSGEDSKRNVSVDDPVSAFIFKTVSEMHLGELSFLKIYSGVFESGSDMMNSSQSDVERIGQVFIMNGKERKETEQLVAGDIGAVVKLKKTHSNDTLCKKSDQIVYPAIKFPTPNIQVAVRPKAKGDEDKISTGLNTLHYEDPSFHVAFDSELKQQIISGQGELHLDVILKRLKQRYGVEVDMYEPKIPYRETLRGKTEIQGKYKKQSGGRGQYGDCWLRLESQETGTGFEFVDAIVGGVIPGKYIPAVEKGVVETMGQGVLAGYPVVDVKVTVFDGSYHNVDSSEMAFKIAASMALKKGFPAAKPVILEPVWDVEIVVPEEYMGDVMGDISGRRGKISGMEAEGNFQVIKAKVPLSEMYKYATTLRSITSGRGLHRSKFSHYEEVPREFQEKLIAEYQERREEGK